MEKIISSTHLSRLSGLGEMKSRLAEIILKKSRKIRWKRPSSVEASPIPGSSEFSLTNVRRCI